MNLPYDLFLAFNVDWLDQDADLEAFCGTVGRCLRNAVNATAYRARVDIQSKMRKLLGML
jgi:hypothetical protein